MADYFSRRAKLSIRPSRCPIDRLDRDIRAYSTACYYEVIYVQGARFLDDLRRDFGAAPFRRAVRAYTAAHQLGIGGNATLLESLPGRDGGRRPAALRAALPEPLLAGPGDAPADPPGAGTAATASRLEAGQRRYTQAIGARPSC